MTELQRINRLGLARGWHAEMLLARAKRSGRTMAAFHTESVRGVSAFAVPAEAVAIRGGQVHYRFLDGSVSAYPYVKRRMGC